MMNVVKSTKPMREPLDSKVWSQPRWIPYLIATFVAMGGICLAVSFPGQSSGNLLVGFLVLPVAITTLYGGFGPSCVSSIVGFAGLLLMPFLASKQILPNDANLLTQSGLYLLICTCLCMGTRRIESRLQKANLETQPGCESGEQHLHGLLDEERLARTTAEEASQMKDEFLSLLSHELRSPMASLSGWTTLLTSKPYSAELFKEGLECIDRSTKLQTRILEELSDMSRLNAGKVEVEREYLDFSTAADEAISNHMAAAKARNISLAFAEEPKRLIVRGDTTRLGQVISILISNAIKFTKKGGTVKVSMSEDGLMARCTVEDDGEGIEPALLPDLFDRNRRAKSSHSRKSSGLGLGLSIAKQLIELQGGTLVAHSSGVDMGSSFTASLPLVP